MRWTTPRPSAPPLAPRPAASLGIAPPPPGPSGAWPARSHVGGCSLDGGARHTLRWARRGGPTRCGCAGARLSFPQPSCGPQAASPQVECGGPATPRFLRVCGGDTPLASPPSLARWWSVGWGRLGTAAGSAGRRRRPRPSRALGGRRRPPPEPRAGLALVPEPPRRLRRPLGSLPRLGRARHRRAGRLSQGARRLIVLANQPLGD